MQETSPQLEEGHIRIANELYDAILSYPFTGRQLKVVLAIMRKTYGFGKKQDDISASQIGSICGISRTHATSTMNQLAEMNIITKQPGVYGSIVGMNKAYSTWRTSTESVQVSQSSTSTESVQGVPKSTFASTESVQVDSTESVHTKDNLPKDNKQKTCANAFARFWSAYPKKKSKGQAEKAFQKLNPSEQLMDAMLASIEQAKTSDNWRKDGGQFIPYPATWLNAKGWEDEDVAQANSDGPWWLLAGFESLFEAENAGCNKFIYQQFRDGKRLEATA